MNKKKTVSLLLKKPWNSIEWLLDFLLTLMLSFSTFFLAEILKLIKTIKITQEDIDNGVRKQGGFCPVALSCKRDWGGTAAAIGNIAGSVKVPGQGWLAFFLPGQGAKFVSDFDNNLPVEPITFEVTVYNKLLPI